jgi:hypothetical protein
MMPPAVPRSKARMESRSRAPVPRVLVALLLLGLLAAGGAVVWNAHAETPPPKAPAEAPKAPADSAKVAADTTAIPDGVVAYYFHTTKRCVSCRKIEAFAQEAIETGFPEELKSGRLAWRVVNIEEKGNEHFVKDYQLFTKSIVLVDERDGKKGEWKNLPKIWEYLNNKTQFAQYVQQEIRAFVTAEPR